MAFPLPFCTTNVFVHILTVDCVGVTCPATVRVFLPMCALRQAYVCR